MISSAVCRPVPSVNEPHYLCKAKHYWNPQWCGGDLFLESSNPHLVFYQTVGVLTQWLPLPQAAWAGRLIVLALLAWGWTRLTSRLVTHRWAAVGAACLFLLLQTLGNFSGEWLVGGVESKVIAYAFAFLGWTSVIEARPVRAGAWLGLATSFHPVVGGWCLIALGVAAVGFARSQSDGSKVSSPSDADGPGEGRRADWSRWLIGGAVLVACALPGMLPAIASLEDGDSAAAGVADRIQVAIRLPHHLDPMAFPLADYRYYGLLIVVWLMIRRAVPPSPARRWFAGIVGGALLIALAGFIAGWGPRPIQDMALSEFRVRLLKFYPFRLADLLVPMLVSVTAIEALTRGGELTDRSGWRRWFPSAAAALAFGLALWLPNPDKNPSRMSTQQQADWLAMCAWVRSATPGEALLYAANEDWAVKWYCHRPEYVNYKDCPQETAGILEWVRRLRAINRWHRDAFRDVRISREELRQLHKQTGITHLLVSRLGPIDAAPAYQNDSFRVYAIADP